MGKIIEVRFEEIMPGELGFQPIRLLEIIRRSAKGENPLPIPIRESESVPNKKVHLEGRHRLLYYKMTGQEKVNCYLAEFQEDFIDSRTFPGIPEHRYIRDNQSIALRWKDADVLAGRLTVRDYNEYYAKLVESYPFMENEDAFMKFVKRKSVAERRYIYGLPELIGLSEC